jgi:hypothetical protein
VPASSSSPTVLLDVVTEAGIPPGPLDAAESISLLQALSTLPDSSGLDLGPFYNPALRSL